MEEEHIQVNDKSEVNIGFFTLLALFLLLAGWAWLKNDPLLGTPQKFNVHFHYIAGLNTNAAVYVDGVRVGSVDHIDLKGKNDVVVRLKINTQECKIPQGATFAIETAGLVGAKFVDVTLPDVSATTPPPLDMNSSVEGKDPARIELAMNKIADGLSRLDIDRIEHNMDKLASTVDIVAKSTRKLGAVADQAVVLEDRAFGVSGNINELAISLRGTSHRLNKILDNPALTTDLRETASNAKDAAQNLAVSMKQLNQTLSDKPMRQDMLEAMGRLTRATENISKSAESLQHVADDPTLRSDMKDILNKTNLALTKVDKIITEPLGNDLAGTVRKVNSAVDHLDLATQQMTSIMNKKHPLLHLVFGRPGHLKNMDDNGQRVKSSLAQRAEIAKTRESSDAPQTKPTTENKPTAQGDSEVKTVPDVQPTSSNK